MSASDRKSSTTGSSTGGKAILYDPRGSRADASYLGRLDIRWDGSSSISPVPVPLAFANKVILTGEVWIVTPISESTHEETDEMGQCRFTRSMSPSANISGFNMLPRELKVS